MADIKYYDVILKPVVTEKSMSIMADRKYTFLVNPEANKSQVKEAVEKMFDEVKVRQHHEHPGQEQTPEHGSALRQDIEDKESDRHPD